MLACGAVLTAHAVVAKEATVKLLKRLEHIILLHDLSAVCHVLNAGYLLSSQRRSKSDGQLTAATFHLANTNAVAHVAARCTRCIHTRCNHIGSAAICGVNFGGVYLDYMWPLNYFKQQHCLLSTAVCGCWCSAPWERAESVP